VIGAYAQLRVPRLTYFSKRDGKFIFADLNISGSQSYGKLAVACNWRVLVEKFMNGEIKVFLKTAVETEEDR
jgi:hypothetical protein